MEATLEKYGISAAVIGDDRSIHAYCTSSASETSVKHILAAASGLTLLQVGATPHADLPRLSSGKIDYGRLTQQFAGRSTESDSRQETVQNVFAQLFYPARVGPQDSFLSLGGDSLRFVQLSIALERILGEAPPNWENACRFRTGRKVKRTETAPKLEASLLIRALAILFVVVQHETLWPIPGGSAAMVLLVGFGLARFQWRAVTELDIVRLFRSALPIVIPYYLIVAGYTVAWGEVPWASVVMAGNFWFADPDRHTMLPYLYWFVEAYCQTLLLFAGFFALAPIRKIAASSPFSAGLVLLGVALLARLVIPDIWQIGNRQIFTLPWILYLAAIGFLAAFADTTAKRLLLMAAGTVVFSFFAFYESVWIGTRVKYFLQIPQLSCFVRAETIGAASGESAGPARFRREFPHLPPPSLHARTASASALRENPAAGFFHARHCRGRGLGGHCMVGAEAGIVVPLQTPRSSIQDDDHCTSPAPPGRRRFSPNGSACRRPRRVTAVEIDEQRQAQHAWEAHRAATCPRIAETGSEREQNGTKPTTQEQVHRNKRTAKPRTVGDEVLDIGDRDADEGGGCEGAERRQGVDHARARTASRSRVPGRPA